MAAVWQEMMDQARGRRKIDLVLRRAHVVNVFSGEVHLTEIGIHSGFFVGLGEFPAAEHVLDLDGRYVVPGLIDGHVHIESSLLGPAEFCAVLLAHGVTTAVVDPHEIANVCGKTGIRYILDSIVALPFNCLVALPSCVPATGLETSGARLEAADLADFIGHSNVLGLGEVMNYQAVLAGEPSMVAKLQLPLAFKDGHAPGIKPQDLNAYFLAGMHTDHECSTLTEVRERLRRGYYVMLREGSAAKNLVDLLPAVTDQNYGQFLFVTDDRHPNDLLNEGSIDHLVRLAIEHGLSPIRAVQMATLNAARALGLTGLGAIAPGYQADFVILDDLERFKIQSTFWRGREQCRDGKPPQFAVPEAWQLGSSVNIGAWSATQLKIWAGKSGTTNSKAVEAQDAPDQGACAAEGASIPKETGMGQVAEAARNTAATQADTQVIAAVWRTPTRRSRDLNCGADCEAQALGAEDAAPPARSGNSSIRGEVAIRPERVRVRVIGVQASSLVTSSLIRELPVVGGEVYPDPEQAIAKLAVVERHHGSGRVGLAFIQGLGLQSGAIASTVAHDAHNLVVAGMSDREMDLAIRLCVEMGGGMCVVKGEQVLERLALPVGGLMSSLPAAETALALARLHQAVACLGVPKDRDPFMLMAFMSLPVIPNLKLTDHGLVDVEHCCLLETVIA